MINNLLKNSIPYIIIVALLSFIFLNNCSGNYKDSINIKKDSIYAPIKIDSAITSFDTIKIPAFIIRDSIIYKDNIIYKENPINQELLNKYKNSIYKLELYKKAITEFEYIQIFEDSIQKVDVYSKTRGVLLEQSVNVLIKPKNIPHYNHTVTKTIIRQDRSKVFIGGGIIIPSINNKILGFKLNLMFKNKNQNVFNVSLDNKKNIYLDYNINIW
jgi:hypothetical protein